MLCPYLIVRDIRRKWAKKLFLEVQQPRVVRTQEEGCYDCRFSVKLGIYEYKKRTGRPRKTSVLEKSRSKSTVERSPKSSREKKNLVQLKARKLKSRYKHNFMSSG